MKRRTPLKGLKRVQARFERDIAELEQLAERCGRDTSDGLTIRRALISLRLSNERVGHVVSNIRSRQMVPIAVVVRR